MNVYLLCFISLLELIDPSWGPSYADQVRKTMPARFATCVDILQVAEVNQSKVPLELIAATAYEESKFIRTAVSSAGAIGPLQILPKYYCPGGKAKGCDVVQEGIATIGRFFKRYKTPERALCHFVAGNRCTAGGRRYANRIISRAIRYTEEYRPQLVDLVTGYNCIDRDHGYMTLKAFSENCEFFFPKELLWQNIKRTKRTWTRTSMR